MSLEHELLTEPNQHQLDTVPQRALVTKLYFAGFLKTEGDDFERDHTFQKVDPLKVKEKDNKSSVFRPQKMPKKKWAEDRGTSSPRPRLHPRGILHPNLETSRTFTVSQMLKPTF